MSIYEKKFWGKKVSDPYISENVKKNFGKKIGKMDYFLFTPNVSYHSIKVPFLIWDFASKKI